MIKFPFSYPRNIPLSLYGVAALALSTLLPKVNPGTFEQGFSVETSVLNFVLVILAALFVASIMSSNHLLAEKSGALNKAQSQRLEKIQEGFLVVSVFAALYQVLHIAIFAPWMIVSWVLFILYIFHEQRKLPADVSPVPAAEAANQINPQVVTPSEDAGVGAGIALFVAAFVIGGPLAIVGAFLGGQHPTALEKVIGLLLMAIPLVFLVLGIQSLTKHYSK